MSDFNYDVFLSHSSHDKETVRSIAERLQADGVKVWFDEWMIKPGDSIPAKIEEGLEQSRVLVFCMSAKAFGSDWAQLESYTYRHRDPLNRELRFIPLRLDDAPIKGSLAQFSYIDWRTQPYANLFEACRRPAKPSPPSSSDDGRPLSRTISLGHTGAVWSVAFSGDGRSALSGSGDHTLRLWDVATGHCQTVFEGHTNEINCVAFSGNGHSALSGSDDATLRLWDVATGHCQTVFEGHTGVVWSVAFSGDGRSALSGSSDNTLRLWDVATGHCQTVFEGHTNEINCVAFSGDGRSALSGSDDHTLRLWDVATGHCQTVFEGHTGAVWSVAFSGDGRSALSGSDDHTLRLWDVATGHCQTVFEGHTGAVRSVAFSGDGRSALSGSDDHTLRLWDVATGHCQTVFEGHTGAVWSVAFSGDGRSALSGSDDHTLRLWDVATGHCQTVFEGHTNEINCVAFSSDGRSALSGSDDETLRLWDVATGHCQTVFEGHTNEINCVAFSGDGRSALSGSVDSTLRLWDVATGHCQTVFEGHTGAVWSVAFSSDGRSALSGSDDETLRLWDVATGHCQTVFEGHTNEINCVAFSSDGRSALSGSDDETLRLWDVATGHCQTVFEGHTNEINCVAFSGDGRSALSGSSDNTLRLWDVATGHCQTVLEGHTNEINCVAFSGDGRSALSGSVDSTLRLWDVATGHCQTVFEGHTGAVWSVAFSSDGRHGFSQTSNGVLRIWDLTPYITQDQDIGEGNSITAAAVPDQVQYTNAKVLLVGNSGAGKTGLSNRLALKTYTETDSTVGAWSTRWPLSVDSNDGVECEVWLWDFGGQADQRLIHQLYMDQTQVAALVFDPQKPNLLEGLATWDRDLTRAATGDFQKLLVAGRRDAGGLRGTSKDQVERWAQEHGFVEYIETSAKENTGCDELKQAICKAIDWNKIAKRTTPVLFRRLKEEIVALKDEGRMLMRFNELRDTLTLRLASKMVDSADSGSEAPSPQPSPPVGRGGKERRGSGKERTPGRNSNRESTQGRGSGIERFTDAELKAVITLLAGPGVVWELGFGSWVLLAPELINAYAQAVIRTIQEDERELGCITEECVLAGRLNYPNDLKRLPEADERILLLAMHRLLVENSLCLSEPAETGTLLIFPSYARRERPELIEHPSVMVSYQFEGFLDDIYATLVVRLHRSGPFETKNLWNGAADFETMTGQKLGVKLIRKAAGKAELLVYFDPGLPVGERMIFSKYVHEHLLRKAKIREKVKRLRHWVCEYCGEPVASRELAMKRLADNGAQAKIICVKCEEHIGLWDEMEAAFADPEIMRRVRELEAEAQRELDNESKERALVGDVISTVALAGQISREFAVSDHGIDMEIEFKDDADEATGQRLYLQLKSGDSHLATRKRDHAQIFKIPKQRHARYWMEQAYPVMLVIRNSEGEIRWMEVRDHLKKITNAGEKQVRQIEFVGERFDVMSVRRWRERALG